MKIKPVQIIVAFLVAAPLATFAFMGSSAGALQNNGASQGYGVDKVTICTKNERTITVASPAVDAHLANGATIGACGN
jgi:hypothetical protein